MVTFSLSWIRYYVYVIFTLVVIFPLFSFEEIETIDKLRTLSPGSYDEVKVGGYYEADDDGGGMFLWDANSRAHDNGGTVITPDVNPSQGRWIRDTSGYDYYNILWFGATGDDNPHSYNHKRIMNAFIAAVTDEVYEVYFPIGIYKSHKRITLNSFFSGLTIRGDISYTMGKKGEYPLNLSPLVKEFPAWSDRTEFRIVDENNSSILKFADEIDSPGLQHELLRISDDVGNIHNITIKNIAFNGNHQNSDTERGHAIILLQGITGDINITNVAVYRAGREGLVNRVRDGGVARITKVLSYANLRHGFGISGSDSSATQIYEDIEAHHNFRSGFYGVDLGGDSRAVMRNFNLHHNALGFKTSSAHEAELYDGEISYNLGNGFTQSGHGVLSILKVDNVISYKNGNRGFRIEDGKQIEIGKIEAYDNDKDGSLSTAQVLITTAATIEQLIARDYNGRASYSVRIQGDVTIKNLRVFDNNTNGIEISGDVKILSGELYNNTKIGIFIVAHHKIYISNVKFGNPNDPIPYRQSYREIYCNGEGTLIHSGLDFSNSKTSPENRIRVNTIKKVD